MMQYIIGALLWSLCVISPIANADQDHLVSQNSPQQWIEHMQTALPVKLCSIDSVFRTEFTVSESECLELTHLLCQACLNNVEPQLPASISAASGKKWGGLTARCIDDLYHKFYASRKISPTTNATPL